MSTMYRRKTMRRRFLTLCDDCFWWWNRNGTAFMEGFVFGVLCVVIVTEIVLGV